MKKFFLLIALLGLLMACQPQTSVQEPTATSGLEQGVQKQDTADLPVFGEGTVIIYQKTGGFAGVSEQWTFLADGRIVDAEGVERQAAVEAIETLLTTIEAGGFFEMKASYIPRNTCCDRFTYRLTVRSGGKEHTVATLDAAPDTPPALWEILDGVQEMTQALSE